MNTTAHARLKRGFLIALAALIVFAITTVDSGLAWRSNKFKTPSGNIRCQYGWHGAGLMRCGMVHNGFGYDLGSYGRASPTLDEVYRWAYQSMPVLRYRQSWTSANTDIVCVSRRTGLRCVNEDGRGFFLSRERSYRF